MKAEEARKITKSVRFRELSNDLEKIYKEIESESKLGHYFMYYYKNNSLYEEVVDQLEDDGFDVVKLPIDPRDGDTITYKISWEE